MKKIVPCLWFTDQAEEAAAFYVSVFGDSQVTRITRYGKGGRGPEGSVMAVSFSIGGCEFVALNGARQSAFTPATSFFVNCSAREEVDRVWEGLSQGGSVLMELDAYPFSERYGWIQDKYGVSWQVNVASRARKITPCLLFVGAQHGKAEEAMGFYVSLFEDSRISVLERYGPGQGETEGTVMYAAFSLAGHEFAAMDSGLAHPFTFTEAVSLIVNCSDPADVDTLLERLSSGGGSQGMMGWLKDKYGVSWQVAQALG